MSRSRERRIRPEPFPARALRIGVALLLGAAIAIPAAGAEPVTSAPPTADRPDNPPHGRWSTLETGTDAEFSSVSFSDPLHGHVVGAGGTILATTDGGRNWQPQHACKSPKTCAAASKLRITADLSGVGVWDAKRGVAVGTGGTVLTTTDGGRTWTPRSACERSNPCRASSSDRTAADLTAVSVVAPSHAYAVGKAGTILGSDDHGRTWRRLATCGLDVPVKGPCGDDPPEQPADLAAVTATPAGAIQAVGAGGAVFSSRTGGRSWRRVGVCLTGCSGPLVPAEEQVADRERGIERELELPVITTDLSGVAFPGRRSSVPDAYAVGAGGTIVTTESGYGNWIAHHACTASEPCTESSPERVAKHLRAIDFPNDRFGYAVGDAGTIVSLKRPPAPAEAAAGTSPVDALWRTEDSGTTENLRALSLPTPGVGYAVGEAGTVVKLSASAPGVQLDAVRPARGPAAGRNKVTITGKGFTGASGVYFGPVRAFGYTVDSDTQITATAPPWPAGGVIVSVVTPGGPSPAVGAARYTYVAPTGGAWEATPGCVPACPGRAVALAGGKVLVAGGGTQEQAGGSAETKLYDPKTRTWTVSAPLSQPTTVHTLTALADGRALVAGGIADVASPGRRREVSVRSGAEVYEARTGTWSPAGELTEIRYLHAATLLADGRVLLTGGFANVAQSGAEIWNPASKAFTPTGSMRAGRFRHTATRLSDGTVLVVGGCSFTCEEPLASAEIFEPASGRWRPAGALNGLRAGHTATVMPNGHVLVVGGVAAGEKAMRSAELYDPKTGRWTRRAPLRVPRALHSATLLDDGTVLVAGGVSHDPTRGERARDLAGEPVTSAEIYDPASDRWSLVSEMPIPRALHTGLLLSTACERDCGKVLVVGGPEPFAPPLLYEPAGAGAEGPEGMDTGPVLLLAGGVVAVVGAVVLARGARRRQGDEMRDGPLSP